MAPGALPIDIEGFLARHWQREPLLLAGAFPGFVPPIDANELAGLAMEGEVESRIVEEAGGQWRVSHGPFGESDFQRPDPWTLLVQAVDQYLPAVAALRAAVDFIPDWRADDIMVSYATDGGSVGPHFDHYDVFLLQGAGERLWRLGQRCDHRSELLPERELRILAHFDCEREYLLGPGDMLYVPPGVAHWGIARGECTTFSIGFRAPRREDLLARLADRALEEAPPDSFFTDPGRNPAQRPGELSEADIAKAREQALALLQASDSPHWFGELVTEPRYAPDAAPASGAVIHALMQGHCQLVRAPGARLAWLARRDALYVFANGESHVVDPACTDWVAALCAGKPVICDDRAGPPATRPDLLTFLLDSGSCHAH